MREDQVKPESSWLPLRVAALAVMIAALRSTWVLTHDPADRWQKVAALPAQRIHLATASWPELAWLPGIGKRTAQSIVATRARLGAPLSIENLSALPGVGASTAARIPADWVVRMPLDSVSALPPPK